MLDLFGDDWLRHGRMILKFVQVVEPGDTLVSKATVQSKQSREAGTEFLLDVWCENQRGDKVVVGTATGSVPQL